MNASVVRSTSPFFMQLMYGDEEERAKRSAELLTIDPDTFRRFLNYVKHREYTVPPLYDDDAIIVETRRTGSASPEGDGSSAPESGVLADGTTYTFLPVVEMTEATNALADLRDRIFGQKYLLNDTESDWSDAGSLLTQVISYPAQDFTEVLLAHAKVYTFATMTSIPELRNLALNNLQQTLKGFVVYPERVRDLVELARYAYSNGASRSADGTMDSLRELVVSYIACEITTIRRCPEFVQLLEEGGEFASDLRVPVGEQFQK